MHAVDFGRMHREIPPRDLIGDGLLIQGRGPQGGSRTRQQQSQAGIESKAFGKLHGCPFGFDFNYFESADFAIRTLSRLAK
jgi:hypothetical protein